jgi:hypothetical protein
MMQVKLIEVFKQHLNYCEVIATVTTPTGKNILGISEFFTEPEQIVPDDEDELCDFINSLDLPWDLYVPVYEEV